MSDTKRPIPVVSAGPTYVQVSQSVTWVSSEADTPGEIVFWITTKETKRIDQWLQKECKSLRFQGFPVHCGTMNYVEFMASIRGPSKFGLQCVDPVQIESLAHYNTIIDVAEWNNPDVDCLAKIFQMSWAGEDDPPVPVIKHGPITADGAATFLARTKKRKTTSSAAAASSKL